MNTYLSLNPFLSLWMQGGIKVKMLGKIKRKERRGEESRWEGRRGGKGYIKEDSFVSCVYSSKLEMRRNHHCASNHTKMHPSQHHILNCSYLSLHAAHTHRGVA